MADQSTRTDQPPRTSPWPILIALGLVCAEIGILFDLFPVSVGGLVLFAASLVGILAESGHVSSPWPLAVGLGGAMLLAGALVYALGTGLLAAPRGLELGVGFASRGVAIAVAGALALVGSLALRTRSRRRR